MKDIFFKIFNPIPINNRKLRIWVNQIASLLLVVIALFYQYTLTDKILEFDNISIYSNQNSKITTEDISSRLQKHEINFKSNIDIFLPSTASEYDLWTYYMFKGTLGLNQHLLNRIFINPILPENRTISDIIIHELGHSYLKQEYGYLKMKQIPEWKQEGFCEYISESSTMDYKEGLSILLDTPSESELLNTNSLKEKKYKYFKYRLIFQYLIEQKKMTAKQIIESDIDIKTIENEIKQELSAPNTI